MLDVLFMPHTHVLYSIQIIHVNFKQNAKEETHRDGLNSGQLLVEPNIRIHVCEALHSRSAGPVPRCLPSHSGPAHRGDAGALRACGAAYAPLIELKGVLGARCCRAKESGIRNANVK